MGERGTGFLAGPIPLGVSWDQGHIIPYQDMASQVPQYRQALRWGTQFSAGPSPLGAISSPKNLQGRGTIPA